MARHFYSDSISTFRSRNPDEILGILSRNSSFADEPTQKTAWMAEIEILKDALKGFSGSIFFEYSIPRMGSRIDVVLLIGPVLFVLEFKVGENEHPPHAIDQVWDYALDLKNFHETSHAVTVAPVLISTAAPDNSIIVAATAHGDKVLQPVLTNSGQLQQTITEVLRFADGKDIPTTAWEAGRYSPTPTIVEAAKALYAKHSVEDIARNDAGAINIARTSKAISSIIIHSKTKSRKSICFVTGVPGAGKTLVGLDVANTHFDKKKELSVFLSGNGPLVAVLREALARDSVLREKQAGRKLKKGAALGAVKAFIQNVHHFRDECLNDESNPPEEHVALFDEAQRAWDLQQTANFMKRKKGRPDFKKSEPEFLISCLDRHKDWAVVVCLVGGGQEINIGESGISEWIDSLKRSYPHWDIYISPNLTDSEYGAGKALASLEQHKNVSLTQELHLAVSMRSFRAENVSLFVKQLLDLDPGAARKTFGHFSLKFPIVLTRDLLTAKQWVRQRARGSERYGILASSQASRLRPHAIDVRAPMNPIHWFLGPKDDVRSAYYLEDVATEFHVQGLELDWACVTWDADFRYSENKWGHFSFVGDKWNRIKKSERQSFLKNSYRVLLTRARQGMAIFVPTGTDDDPTRKCDFYDDTFKYLLSTGIPKI